MSNRSRSDQTSRIVVALLLVAVLVGCDADSSPSNMRYVTAIQSLTGTKLRSHIEILAADEMQGREAGTVGHQKATEYVASRFAEIGLEPLGDAGTYLQHINFLETRIVEDSASVVLHRGGTDTAFEYGKDFIRYERKVPVAVLILLRYPIQVTYWVVRMFDLTIFVASALDQSVKEFAAKAAPTVS